eukprot:8186407-Karenia_brevis.AAC.1
MARALALPPDHFSDQAFITRLSDFGFSKAQISSFFLLMQNPDRFSGVYGSLHVSVIFRSIAQSSWLSSDILSGIICPMSGTLA